MRLAELVETSARVGASSKHLEKTEHLAGLMKRLAPDEIAIKGLTDKMLEWQTGELLKLEIGRDRYTVYVEPKLVVEIVFNELQVSPRYPGGLALRFARVKRYRTDKTAAEADSFEVVKRLAGLS
ncbi:MAG: hypothetical protein FJW20_26490 [Acidimicrobiia bacterium]|nr:hypothetical protein [Acidimicrobiia bacterium]